MDLVCTNQMDAILDAIFPFPFQSTIININEHDTIGDTNIRQCTIRIKLGTETCCLLGIKNRRLRSWVRVDKGIWNKV